MDRRRASKRKKATTTTAAAAGDRLTALPLKTRARIASYLPFQQAVRLSALSRPWRRIHHHTPAVTIRLHDFLSVVEFGGGRYSAVVFDAAAASAVGDALGCRARDASAPKVEVLKLQFFADYDLMRHHAGRILAAADAADVRIDVGGGRAHDASDPDAGAGWALDLPAAARDLKVANAHPAPAIIAGPGAAALRSLTLENVVLGGGGGRPPRLPSLSSLTLGCVTVRAPFTPATSWCPRLEDLDIFRSTIEQARFDIALPNLKFLDLDEVDVGLHDGPPPSGDVAVDAPAMVSLDVYCGAGYRWRCNRDYRSFSLRAPRLRTLCWCNQLAERVDFDAAGGGGVEEGVIEFTALAEVSDACRMKRKLKRYREQMMRMIEGLLRPNMPPESIAAASKACISLEVCNEHEVNEDTGEMIKKEKLSCNLETLMSCRI